MPGHAPPRSQGLDKEQAAAVCSQHRVVLLHLRYSQGAVGDADAEMIVPDVEPEEGLSLPWRKALVTSSLVKSAAVSVTVAAM